MDSCDYSCLLNKGIKAYGKDIIIPHIASFYNKYNNLPIVSMGSGTGVCENMVEKYYKSKYEKDMKWICIDINDKPLDFPEKAKELLKEPMMKIDYHSVDDLITKNNNIVKNCILFLNWCLPNQSTYDYDAIVKLDPVAIYSIYEIFEDNSGAAGGELFFNWTNYNDYILKEEFQLKPGEHHIDYDELMDIRISWWQNKSIPCDEEVMLKQYPCLISNKKIGCCIM
jgi:hypothetical protein